MIIERYVDSIRSTYSGDLPILQDCLVLYELCSTARSFSDEPRVRPAVEGGVDHYEWRNFSLEFARQIRKQAEAEIFRCFELGVCPIEWGKLYACLWLIDIAVPNYMHSGRHDDPRSFRNFWEDGCYVRIESTLQATMRSANDGNRTPADRDSLEGLVWHVSRMEDFRSLMKVLEVACGPHEMEQFIDYESSLRVQIKSAASASLRQIIQSEIPSRREVAMLVSDVAKLEARGNDWSREKLTLEQAAIDLQMQDYSNSLGTDSTDANAAISAAMDNADPGESPDASAPTPALSVVCWKDLAVGVDEDGSILVTSPVPARGDVFPKESAVAIRLPGKRWKVLLDLLASSDDGRSAMKRDLLHGFGYYSKRDWPDEVEKLEHDSYAMSKIKPCNEKLTRAIGDLSRQLRVQVRSKDDAPRKNPPLTASDAREVRALFTCRPLLRDPNGRLRFGRTPNE